MNKDQKAADQNDSPEKIPPMARFWCESTVYPKGGMQYRSLDPFEGDPCRMNFPNVSYHGKPLSFLGEIWIDDPKVAIALMQDGGNVRFEPQQIVDSGLLSYGQVIEVLGGDMPLVWVSGPAGIEKINRKVINTQSGGVPDVDPELDIPIKLVSRMTMPEVTDVAFAFGLTIPPRCAEKKAKQMLFDHLKNLSPEADREGMKKYKALMAESRSGPVAGK